MSDDGKQVRCVVTAYTPDSGLDVFSEIGTLHVSLDLPPIDPTSVYETNGTAVVTIDTPFPISFVDQPFSATFELYLITIDQPERNLMVNGISFSAGGNSQNWRIWINDQNQFEFELRNPPPSVGSSRYIGINELPETAWANCVIGWDGTNAFIEIDGNRENFAHTGYNPISQEQGFRILSNVTGSAPEGYQLANLTVSEDDGDYILIYPMGEGDGTVTYDYGDEQLNGVMNNDSLHAPRRDDEEPPGQPPIWLDIDDVTIFSSEVIAGWTRDMKDYVVSESDLEGWTSTGVVDINQQGIAFPLTDNPGTYPTQQTVNNDAGTTQGDEWDLIIVLGVIIDFTRGDPITSALPVDQLTFARASEYTGEDYTGEDITVDIDIPFFPGARYEDDEWFDMGTTEGIYTNPEDLPTASTQASLPFEDIEDFPDEIFNDLCFQWVGTPLTDLTTGNWGDRFFEFNRFVGNTDFVWIGTTTSAPGRINIELRKNNGAQIDIEHDGYVHPAGTPLDIRVRVSATQGFSAWLNGVKIVMEFPDDTDDWNVPVTHAFIGSTSGYGSHREQNTKLVRIVNADLTDEEIEAWDTWTPPQLAFPEAQGFGRFATGGRGGQVIKVTNLNNSGSGSLHEAINTPGPRNIIFEVSGLIQMADAVANGGLSLVIREPHCSIWGETAPYPGITIKDCGIKIQAPNVIVRHIKSRPGDDEFGDVYRFRDCIDIASEVSGHIAQNIMIDHCSLSWSIGVIFSNFGGDDPDTLLYQGRTTLSNCLVYEPLGDSRHPQGYHPLGTLIYSGGRDITLYRYVQIDANGRGPLLAGRTRSDLINCLWRGTLFENGNFNIQDIPEIPENVEDASFTNIVGCKNSRGADTADSFSADFLMTLFNAHVDGHIYQFDNECPNNDGSYDSIIDVRSADSSLEPDFLEKAQPWTDISHYSILPVDDLEDDLLPLAGARSVENDPLDVAKIADYINVTGGYVDGPTDLSWYDTTSNTISHDVPPNHEEDSGNGYTNLEVWIQAMAVALELPRS